jgi:hypothetical protein
MISMKDMKDWIIENGWPYAKQIINFFLLLIILDMRKPTEVKSVSIRQGNCHSLYRFRDSRLSCFFGQAVIMRAIRKLPPTPPQSSGRLFLLSAG